MNIDSCNLIKYVLEHSNISKWIKEIKIDDSKHQGKLFYSMKIKVEDNYEHLLTNIEHAMYSLISCCESEGLDHKIEGGFLFLN